MPLSVAVVGAGVAGLSGARILREAGVEVTLFEQGALPGGRLSTRRTEVGGFDIGTQYFTCETEPFRAAVDHWIAKGLCARWHARVVRISGTHRERALSEADGRDYLVGVPAMGTLAAHLGEGLDLRCEQRIRRLEPLRRSRPTRWTLKRAADPADPEGIEVTEGIFDAVVVATPAASAAALLEACPELVRPLRAVTMNPCFALLLAFGEPLGLPYEGAMLDQHRLSWIACDSSKPGRRPGERWVAHASGAWSREHFEDDPEDVRAKLVKAFGDATGIGWQPSYSSLYRWPYSAPAVTLGAPFLWSDDERVGACGDWCAGARLESAWMSGRALAHELLRALHRGA